MSLAVVALAGGNLRLLLVRSGILIGLHVVPSGHHPVRDAVSDYAVEPTGRLSAAMSWAGAGGMAGPGCCGLVGLPAWSYPGTATVLLPVVTVIVAALPFVPTDLEGRRRPPRGLLHDALAIAWFTISSSLTGHLSRLASGRWPGAVAAGAVASHWLALVGSVALVAALVIRPLRRWFGLAERGFLGAIAVF